MERITDLKQRFGTKKARKAILETALYAIAPSGDATTTNVDNATRATISTVSAVTSLMATPEEMQAAMDEAKPVPKANLEATSACDVYDPQVIIGTDVFNLVPIQGWQEKARRQEGVKTASRFVAARINRLAVDDDAVTVTRLRVLRYLELVLRFFYYSREGRTKGTRQLPPYNKLLELMEEVPEAVIESIRGKFSDAGTMSKFHMDMLMTHCCAFAFIVDNFEVYTMELRLDMRLEDKEMNRYFQALGGQVSRVRKQGLSPCVAKLELPLKFPKLKQTAPRRRGK
ncbi:hypothetical protein G6O67_008840 [Ophiocordyceps sinensis]|nr:hypothetical protein G6O67_008840 [Ophiocordyceps sinensis]